MGKGTVTAIAALLPMHVVTTKDSLDFLPINGLTSVHFGRNYNTGGGLRVGRRVSSVLFGKGTPLAVCLFRVLSRATASRHLGNVPFVCLLVRTCLRTAGGIAFLINAVNHRRAVVGVHWRKKNETVVYQSKLSIVISVNGRVCTK